jgi:hypothetical protein
MSSMECTTNQQFHTPPPPTHILKNTRKWEVDLIVCLIANKTIINYIKSQRLGWLGHVHRMPDERIVKKKKCMNGNPWQ